MMERFCIGGKSGCLSHSINDMYVYNENMASVSLISIRKVFKKILKTFFG
jgi:hypothetical protein